MTSAFEYCNMYLYIVATYFCNKLKCQRQKVSVVFSLGQERKDNNTEKWVFSC